MVLPAPNLAIGNTSVDDWVIIDSISLTVGRNTITTQPSPATFSCELVYANSETPPTFKIGNSLRWKVNNSTGTSVILFYGTVTDIQISLDWANGNGLWTYRFTAIGPLANLNRCSVGGAGYAKQYAGTRIASILTDAGFGTGAITTPGDYEIAVYNSGSANALTLAQDAAQSSMGVLFENFPNFPNDVISYQTYTGRKTNPVITLGQDDVLATNYTISESSTDIANQVAVTYGTGSSSTVYNDITSQGQFGILSGTRDTTLHNLTDANSIAQILLATKSQPSWNLPSININTSLISDALRDSLLAITVGTRIQINSLVNYELNTFDGFVEGYSWNIGRGFETLTLNLSNYGNSYPYTLWSDLNLTDTWNTIYTATKKWSEVI